MEKGYQVSMFTNIYNNINQHNNNNLHITQTKIYYTQQVLAYKYN